MTEPLPFEDDQNAPAPFGGSVVQAAQVSGNRPERVEWFRTLGLGLFIHWSVDSQLGMVISHSLVGASDDYVRRYFEELPKTFCPEHFAPDEWARLAKVCGFRYMVFTTKHHNGFCMFETATTDFGVMHTPYQQDITRQVVEAFRKQGIAIGFYFSPDDFSVLRRQGIEIARGRQEVDPLHNPDLMALNRAQLRELLTHYGPVDLLFFDGQAEGLKQLAWELQPDVVVTRGDMATPEQRLPDRALPGPWESCITMGTAWQYQPTNETYKSGRDLILLLAEARAKGGNLLLNVGPKPDGMLPEEQVSRLMELGLWNFVNAEAVFGTEACALTREPGAWYTCRSDTVYAILSDIDWTGAEDTTGHNFARGQRTYGKRAAVTLRHVRTGPESVVSVLGQSGRHLEYNDAADPAPRWQQDDAGLHVSIMSSQRIYDAWGWNNPVVLKITQASVPVAGPQV
jgi:alpha-L-fucosidase